MKGSKTTKILKAAVFLCAVSAFILLAVSCSNELLDKVEDDIGTFKEGDVLPAERKPVINVFSVIGNSTTNNPTVSLDITASAQAVNDSGAATLAGYFLSESSTPPVIDDPSWVATEPTAFELAATNGGHTLRLWVKDSFGNLSETSSLGITLAPLGASWENTYTSGMVAAHEELIFTSLEALSGTAPTVLVNGSGGQAVAGLESGNTVVRVRPGASGAGLWTSGAAQGITVQTTTAYGLSIQMTTSVNVFNSTCVSAIASSTGELGTRYHPYRIVQGGIDKAVALYGTGPATVRVAAGTYNTVSCTTSTYVANVAAGISLYGGYNAAFSSQTGGVSNLVDTSTTAVSATELNSVRIINVSGAAITSATVIDRFTITLGTGGTGSETHSGINCQADASPTISNITVQGAGISGTAIGIVLNNSNAEITQCNIDPGASATQSKAIRISGSGYSPSIVLNPLISGGSSSGFTTGIAMYTGTSPIVSGNTIQGGTFDLASKGFCLWISGASPLIENNTLSMSPNRDGTYGVWEASSSSDPSSLRMNRFNYTDAGHNYYWDQGTTGIGLGDGPKFPSAKWWVYNKLIQCHGWKYSHLGLYYQEERMAYEYGLTPSDISLNTYTGFGINDGNIASISGLHVLMPTKPIFIAFVNTMPGAGRDWLNRIGQINDGSYNIYIVAFKYSGGTYQPCYSDFDVLPAIALCGGDSVFSSIPVVVDSTGVVTGTYVNNLFGSSFFDHASVIIDPAYLIADKWNSSILSGAGMSFAHLDTNSFDGSDVTIAGDYALLRIANLNAPLRILGTAPGATPAAGTVINSASDVMSVILSRPINTPAGLASFQLTGGGVLAAPLSPTAFDYSTGTHKAENVVGLTFAAGGLTDVTLDDTVTLTVSLSDTSGTAIVAPDNAISFSADVSAVPALTYAPTYHDNTNQRPIHLTLTFGEAMTAIAPGSIPVTNGSCTAATPDAGTPGKFDLTITPSIAFHVGQITVQIPSGISTDAVGNANTALAPNFVINFDDQSLAPVITAARASDASAIPSGSTIDEALINVRIDFQEQMNAGESFTFTQLTTSNCNIVGVISVDANHRVFTFQAQIPANQTASIAVPAGLMHDLVGNPCLASAAYSARYEPAVVTADRDIILLVDMSASMGWGITIEGVTQPKIDFMRPVITQFLTKLEAAVTAGSAKATDRIGIVQFSSNASIVQAIAGQDLLTLAQGANVITAVGGLTPSGSTALGSGLATALNLLNYSAPSARKRHIVLFADGQDNVAPLVTTSVSQYSIPAPASVTVNATDANKIPIHSIGISTEGHGDTSPWLVKMDNLSTVTGGVKHDLPADQIWPLGSADLDDVITAIYDGSSPQVVFRVEGALEAGTESARQAFELDSGVKGAVVSVSWPGNVPLRINISKDGKKVASYPYSKRVGSCYTCAMKFPFRQRSGLPRASDLESLLAASSKKRPGIDLESIIIEPHDFPGWPPSRPVLFEADGAWEIEVKRLDGGLNERAPYEVSVIAEERKLEMKVELPTGYVFTGYPIDIWLRVTEGGVPVKKIDFAEVKVAKPVASLGNVIRSHEREIFAQTRERGGKANLEGIMDAVRKLPAAAAELKRFKTSKAAFSLNGSGRYLCRLDAPSVPGIYRLDISARGYAPGVGAFERRVSRTLLIEPGVNWKKSILKQHYDPKTGIVELIIEPKDDAGNLLGPGYADWIKAEFSEIGSLKIEDNLNGSYDVKAKAKKDGMKPGRPLKLNVMGRAVWKSGREK